MKGFYFILLICITSELAMASSGADQHGAEHGVPRVVLYQAINVLIIFGCLAYFGRKKITDFFDMRKVHFLKAQEKAQSVLRQAEMEHFEVKTRLDKLKQTKGDSISKAKADATDMKTQMIQEAQAKAARIKDEALMSAKIEVERAKFLLKEHVIKESFELSKKDLNLKATSDDQRKLQEDFITKVQVVQ